jgi:hypothetical protein
MKSLHVFVRFVGACVLVGAAACSSDSPGGGANGSSSGGGGGGSTSGSSGSGSSGGGLAVFCDATIGGEHYCSVWKDITSQQVQASMQQTCTQQGGTLVPSCPSANLVGCCTVTSTAVAAEECFYDAANSGQQMCTTRGGTWSTSM